MSIIVNDKMRYARLLALINMNKIPIYINSSIIAISIIVFMISLYMQELIVLLQLTKGNAISIVTSMFVHYDIKHLLTNMSAIITYTLLLIIMTNQAAYRNSIFKDVENRFRSVYYVFIALGATMVSHTVWITFTQPYMFAGGSSGFSYSLIGINVGYALSSLYVLTYEFFNRKISHERRLYVTYSSVIGIYLFTMFIRPDIFLSKVENANIFIHGLSFLLAFISTVKTYIMLYIRRSNTRHINF